MPGSTYIRIPDQEISDEMVFMCIDFEDSNRLFMSQEFIVDARGLKVKIDPKIIEIYPECILVEMFSNR